MGAGRPNPLGKRRRSGSPLKNPPLRNPGQSLDEAIESLASDELLPYLMFPVFFWFLAVSEWVAKWRAMPRTPSLYAALAAVLSAWSAWRLFHLRRAIREFKLGRDGERIVALKKERQFFAMAGVGCRHFESSGRGAPGRVAATPLSTED